MKNVSLFIAMSLDGYIVDSNGKVDWLNGQSKNEENIDTYSEFIQKIDTVIMGWNTYHQIVTELSPNEWIYDDLKSYVISHRTLVSSDKTIFTKQSPVELVNQLKKEVGKGIWICGGASIVQQLVNEDLIDEYYITIIPTILGSGIKLFDKSDLEIKLKLIKTQSYNGMVDLVYSKR